MSLRELPQELVGNRYRLESVLGEGAVATVFRAFDTMMKRAVAIKLLKDIHDETDIARLWVELRSLQRVRHPCTARTLDMGKTGQGPHYIVMELLEGETLRERLLRDHSLVLVEAVPLLLQVFEGLAACHFHGVIHRDVKPDNVMLLHPDGQRIKLIDFGMAKILHDLSPSVTGVAFVFGTPEYMAPERITGGVPTPASDIYSAGVVAFEMLAGRRPYRGRTPEEIMQNQLSKPLPRFSELDPPVSVPREVRGVIRRCLRKVPAQRPEAQTVADELRRFYGGRRKSP